MPSTGDYSTTLDYTQTSVPVVTDESLNLLLPYLAQPIVQKIVDGSNLGSVFFFFAPGLYLLYRYRESRISAVTITNPQQTSFGMLLRKIRNGPNSSTPGTQLNGNITNTGPCRLPMRLPQ